MWKYGKRILALLLALVLACGLLPAGAAQAAEQEPRVLTEADYAAVDALFDAIDAAEAAPAKRDETQERKTEAAIALVQASDSYVEGSMVRSGNVFTWWTENGIRCVYNPRMRQLRQNMTPETGVDATVNEPVATKGGSPTGKQVYLIGPYYGYDDSFTNQYKTEARRVAQAIGDTDGYTLYSGTAATIDKVAEAVQNGAVVFFDSHGATDYQNPSNELDCITGATGSWLCLTTGTGLTDQDYDDGAAYDGEDAFVNGDVIANHMTKNSPNGMVWMAICFGMATDTMYRPLREKGVEVVYGYSESVTFAGDYLYEETFWEQMLQGKTVAESIATMKSTWGEWDWSTKIATEYGYYDGYSTLAAAQGDFSAFPWVMSSEDTYHPGRRTGGTNYGADSLQTVQSAYTLGELQEVTDPTDPGQILTEAYALGAGEELPYEATLTGVITQVHTAYNATYGNITVIMAVPGYETMPIKCYRLSGSGVDQIGVGDTITVTGTIVNYQHSSGDTEVEFAQGCTLDSWVDGGSTDTPDTPDVPDVPTGDGVTLSFADPENRTEFSTERQVWEQNGITVTNEKAASASDVADYSNPARFYKNSSLLIEYPGMVKFVAACSSASYATAFADSVTGASVTVSGSDVTVQLAAAADSFAISALSGGQVRMNAITVYAAEAQEPEDPEIPDEPDVPEIPDQLTGDTEAQWTLTEDLYIDLAGYSLSGTIATNGFAVYGKDSSTDTYDDENAGLFTCVDENGEAVVPEPLNSDGYQHYLTVSGEEGYSFHRFELAITHMSLAPEVVGVGYKAVLSGDDTVLAQLTETDALSFRLQLEGYQDVYRHFDRDELVSGETVALRIHNYRVEQYGEHKLFAQASMKLRDGTTIFTEEQDLTFRWLAEQVDANYSQYTETQLADFKALLEQFQVVKTWDLPNLFPVEVTSATLDLSDTANRLSWDGTQQIWSANGITLTNNKAASSNAVANYCPIRMYAGSEVIIEAAGMKKLEFDCTGQSSKYVTALYNSLCAISGATVTQSGTTITVELPAAASSVTFTMTAQGRAVALTVYR